MIKNKLEETIKSTEEVRSKIDFNLGGISEIVQMSKQRAKSQELIDDLFGEK